MQTVIDVILKTQGDNNIRKINRDLGQTDAIAKKTQGQLGKTSLAYGKTGVAAKGASAGVGMFGKAVNAALGPIGAALAAVAGLGAAFKAIADQDFAVAKVKSLGVNAGELNAELKQVSAELNNSASVAELTASAYDVASAGFTDAADAAQVLKAASMGATGGFTDMNTAGDALTSVLNAYGMSADQATATMDKFIQTQNDGKIVVDEYARNIGKVASAAASLGVPLEEVNAIIAQSTASGVQAETAFTGLKSAIARLASGEANKALEEYGVSIDAASIESEGLAGSLKKIVNAGVDTGTLLKALGTEAGPALLPVLNNLDKFNELLEKQKDSAGASAAANKLATDTIQGAWKQLTNVFSNFFTEQSAAGDLIKLVLQGITKEIERILAILNIALTPFKVLVGIINGIKQAAEKLGEGFRAAFDSPEGRAFLQVVELIQQKIAEATQWVGERFTKAWNAVLGVVFEIGKFLGTTLLTAIDGVVTGLEKTFGWLPMIGGTIKDAKKSWDGFKKKIEQTEAPVKKVEKSAAEIEEELKAAKQAAIEFAEAQKIIADEVVAAEQDLQGIVKDNNKLYQAEYDMKTAINKLAMAGAKIELEKAKNMKEVREAAEYIYHLTEAQAGLDRALARHKADVAVNELRLKHELIKATLTQVQAEKAVLQAKGESTKAIDEQINKVRQQTHQLQRSVSVQEEIRDLQYMQADAVYEQTMRMAKLTKEQTIKAAKEKESLQANKAIEQSKKGQTAEMQKQNQLQGEINSKQGSGTTSSTGTPNRSYTTKIPNEILSANKTVFKTMLAMKEYYRGLDDAIQEGDELLAKQKRYNQLTTQATEYASVGAREAASAFNQAANILTRGLHVNDMAVVKGGSLPKYGSGGYVNGAQTAVIGEAGPEYVIPANRMDSALANYAAGKRGNAVLSQQVNVTTGPVQQMDGTNYVTLQQATSMSQSAARQGAQMALTQIKTDPGTRRSIGVG